MDKKEELQKASALVLDAFKSVFDTVEDKNIYKEDNNGYDGENRYRIKGFSIDGVQFEAYVTIGALVLQIALFLDKELSEEEKATLNERYSKNPICQKWEMDLEDGTMFNYFYKYPLDRGVDDVACKMLQKFKDNFGDFKDILSKK